MRTLAIPPGPLVGKARDFLLELRITQGEIGKDQATEKLLRWAAEEITPPPTDPEPEADDN
jgi:poly(A) polymerase